MWVLDLYFSSGSWVIVMYLTSQVCSVSLRPWSSSFHLLWISWNHFSHHLRLSNSGVSLARNIPACQPPWKSPPQRGGCEGGLQCWVHLDHTNTAANKHYCLCWFHLALLWNDDSAPVVTWLREPGSLPWPLLLHNHLVHCSQVCSENSLFQTKTFILK